MRLCGSCVLLLLVDVTSACRSSRAYRAAYYSDPQINSRRIVADGKKGIPAEDEALEKLGEVHERQAKVVELKFFGGLKMQEIAEELGVSIKTIEIDWKVAKAWLKKFMQSEI